MIKIYQNIFVTLLMRHWNLDVNGPQVSNVNEDPDSIDIALNKYVDHPIILKTKEYFNEPTEFNFPEVIPHDFEEEIKKLDSSKKGTFKDNTLKSIKEASDVFSPKLCDIWDQEIAGCAQM